MKVEGYEDFHKLVECISEAYFIEIRHRARVIAWSAWATGKMLEEQDGIVEQFNRQEFEDSVNRQEREDSVNHLEE